MKKLKIGIMTDLLLIGGVQKAAIEQVRELNKMGHKAKLLIQIRKNYSNDFSYLLNNVPHQYLSDSYSWPFKKTIKFPIFSFLSTLHLLSPILVQRVVKSGDYDLLISWGSTTCLTANALFRLKKIPYVAIIHDPISYILDKVYSKTFLKYFFPILKPIVEKFEGQSVQDALKTIVISKVHYAFVKNRYKIYPAIIPLGIKITNNFSRTRGDTILSFARWQREKNPAFLLKLAKLLPAQQFVIAGSWINSNDLDWFQSQIKKNKLEKQVKLISHYTDQELDNICKNARLWVHPHFEAFGLAALEAASRGLPIIFPNHSGMTESFKHKVHGFFPTRVSTKQYLKYINILLSNQRLAEQMGMRAREVVKREFSWSTKVKELMKYVK